jgi:hypothetical protein
MIRRYLTCREILRYGAGGLSSPPKEDVLWIFVVLKNPSHPAGLEPANLGPCDSYANHYTTEDDDNPLIFAAGRKVRRNSNAV